MQAHRNTRSADKYAPAAVRIGGWSRRHFRPHLTPERIAAEAAAAAALARQVLGTRPAPFIVKG